MARVEEVSMASKSTKYDGKWKVSYNLAKVVPVVYPEFMHGWEGIMLVTVVKLYCSDKL